MRPAPAFGVLLALAACHGAYDPPDPGLRVVGGPLAVSEAGGTATFEVALALAPQAPVEVDVLSGDASEGLVSGPGGGPGAWIRLRFTASDWDVPQAVTVTGADDALRDGDVAWQALVAVSGSDDAGYAAAPGAAVPVVTLDDDTPAIRISRSTLLTAEAGAVSAAFEVSLASQPSAVVTIAVSSGDVSEGLVSGGPHAIAPAPWIDLVFTPSSWSTPQAVTVTAVPDHVVDGDATYAVTVGPATGDAAYAALPAQEVTVANADVDVVGVIVTSEALGVPEGQGRTFQVRLATEPTGPVTIPVVCGSPQAYLTSPAPYAADGSSATLVLAGALEVQTVTVWGRWDGIVDGPQVVPITFGPATTADPLYAALPPQIVEVTILDADAAWIGAYAQGALGIREGGSSAIGVYLGDAPAADVAVTIASSDAGEVLLSADGSPPARSVTLTFAAGAAALVQTVAVLAVDDALLELGAPHPFAISVGPTESASAFYDGLVGPTLQGVVYDDEAE